MVDKKQDAIQDKPPEEEDIFSSFGEEVTKEETKMENLPEWEKGEYEFLDPYWDIPLPVIQKRGISEQQRKRIEDSNKKDQIEIKLQEDPYFGIPSPFDKDYPIDTIEGDEEEIFKEEKSTDPYLDIPVPVIKKRGISEQQKKRIEQTRIRDQVELQLQNDPYFGITSPLEKEELSIDTIEEREEEIKVEESPSPKDSPLKYTPIMLSGRLRMAIDGTQLEEGDMQILKNLRYGRKSPKSISGMTKINTSIFYSG